MNAGRILTSWIGRCRLCAAVAAGLVSWAWVAAPAADRQADQPPNIVLVLVDDLGWSELGCYGHRFNRTPNLDRLAGQGMRFTDAYASAPVCSPTRAALMTGQYPARVGITDYLRKDDERFLSPDVYTLAEALKAGGYATGLVGKWHLTGDYTPKPGRPQLHGFDEVLCSETRYIGAGGYFVPYPFMPEVQARAAGEYLTDRLNREAVDFIGRHRDRPFFLFLSHYSVHTPLAAKKEMVDRFARMPDAGQSRNNPVLAAMLASIDEGLGRIAEALDELGLAGRTVVIFTSDNGGETRVTSNDPLRGGKSELYEGGIRVPLIVRWPGTVSPGTTCHVPVATMDLYPTLLEIAGLGPRSGQAVDGRSLAGLLCGTGTLDREALYWHYPLDKPHFLGGRSSSAVRRGNLKLIEFLDADAVELYDLHADPGERVNLAECRSAQAAELRRALARWREAMNVLQSASRPAPSE